MCACDCTICTWPCATQHSIHIYIYSRTCAPARLTVHWHTAFEILISHKRTAKHGTAQEKYLQNIFAEMPYIGPNTRSRVDSRRRLIFLLCALGDRLPSGIRKCFNINMIAVKFAVASVHIFMAWLFVVPARRLYAQCRSDGRLFFVLFCSFVHQKSPTKRRYHAENKKQKTTKTFSKCIVRNNDFVLCAVHHLLLFRTQKNRTKKLFFFIFFFKLNFCSIRLF